MEEALLWIPITIAELLLLVSIALTVFLKRARTAERQARLRIEDLERARERERSSPAPSSTPPSPVRPEPPASDFEGTESYRQLEQLFPVAEAPELDRCIEVLQQRLHETSECLQNVTAELQNEKTLSDLSQRVLADLRENLKEMAREVTALRHANARLHQELRSKKDVVDGAVLADNNSKERILLYIKRLRDDLAALQLKLAGSEAEALRLRQEKQLLADDYNTLTLEYERIYANFRK